MEPILTELEARVLGCLIEKHHATPDLYPLSLRSLATACNQRSNRAPVMEVGETAVEEAVTELRYKGLAWMVSPASGRTQKFKHHLEHFGDLNAAEQAVLCELLLRGPQTQAELRARVARLGVETTQETLSHAIQSLKTWGESPLVTELPREPGRRETRFAHCLCGPPESQMETTRDDAPLRIDPLGERIQTLEQTVSDLQTALADLEHQFAQFSAQFQ